MTVPLLPPPIPFSVKQVALPLTSTPSASAKMSPAGHGLVPKALVFVFPQTRHAKVVSPSDGDTSCLELRWALARSRLSPASALRFGRGLVVKNLVPRALRQLVWFP